MHYEDATVTLHHGDCLDVLRELPDASVDAVVTDPPYGLEFMGKGWDAPWLEGVTGDKAGFAEMSLPDGSTRTLPSFVNGRTNPTCRVCGGTQRGQDRASRKRCKCDAPDFPPTHNRTAPMQAFGAWCEVWTAECLRVLKPGGHLLAFGGTRTWHRLACAVEDAGFEVRDSIAWMYGSGFPKSLDVAKAITGTQLGHGGNSGAIRRATMGEDYTESGRRGNRDGAGRRDTGLNDHALPLTPDGETWQGWGTALKPAFEPIVVARKPLVGTVAANVLAHGTGALNVDGCRVGTDEIETNRYTPGRDMTSFHGSQAGNEYVSSTHTGRWPANVVLDEQMAGVLDEQSGQLTSGALDRSKITATNSDGWRYNGERSGTYEADTGGASRFFYVAKADASERVRYDPPCQVHGVRRCTICLPATVAHPTVKPIALMRWLVRLVTPPGGTVLEPFAGSGTTVEACILEGFRCVAIEREADYLPLIKQRIHRRRDPVEAVRGTGEDMGLFADLDFGGAA